MQGANGHLPNLECRARRAVGAHLEQWARGDEAEFRRGAEGREQGGGELGRGVGSRRVEEVSGAEGPDGAEA